MAEDEIAPVQRDDPEMKFDCVHIVLVHGLVILGIPQR